MNLQFGGYLHVQASQDVQALALVELLSSTKGLFDYPQSRIHRTIRTESQRAHSFRMGLDIGYGHLKWMAELPGVTWSSSVDVQLRISALSLQRRNTKEGERSHGKISRALGSRLIENPDRPKREGTGMGHADGNGSTRHPKGTHQGLGCVCRGDRWILRF